MAAQIRSHILSVSPYQPGKPIDELKRELGLSHVIKLASNENPLGPSPMAIEAVKKASEEMNLYPDGSAFELKEAISKKFQIPHNQILLGNGSDELIQILGVMYLGSPDDELIMGEPSFIRYEAAALLAPAKLIKIPLTQDWKYDLDAIARAVTPRTKLIFIANPNNPTGSIVTKNELDHFLATIPPSVTVVLDEAYIEFATDCKDFPNGLDYVKAGKPVIALRTFSKAYGLAGIRIGYGFASPDIVEAYHCAREPFNVNLLAQAAAIAALGDDKFIAKTLTVNQSGLRRLSSICSRAGWKPYPSWANFVLADVYQDAKSLFEAFLKEGVIIRGGHGLGMPTYIRVTVGTNEELDFFEQAVINILRSQGKEYATVPQNQKSQPILSGGPSL